MARYYVLECFEPEDWDDSAMIAESPDLPDDCSWWDGARFANRLPEPLEFRLDTEHSDKLLEMDNSEALVITKRLLGALREAGVDNLDAYPAVIRHEGTGMVSQDYVAANLVGLVSAADLERSKVVGSGVTTKDFDSLALDESKIGNFLMFRLKDSPNAIIVHEKVKAHLQAKGFDTLTFLPPEEWMG